MIDYYGFVLKFVLFILSSLSLIGAFCSVGWMLSDRELKKERYCNSMLHSKVKSQANEIETLRAKNNFLLNCIKEKDAKIKNDTEKIESLCAEKLKLDEEIYELEGSLHRALAAVRDKVDTEV